MDNDDRVNGIRTFHSEEEFADWLTSECGQEEAPWSKIETILNSSMTHDLRMLDLLLYVNFMGWTGAHQKHTGAWYAYKPGVLARGGKLVPNVIPFATTTPTAFKEVMDKLLNEGGVVHLDWIPTLNIWRCRWTESTGEAYRASGPTIEIAVCRTVASKYAHFETRREHDTNSSAV